MHALTSSMNNITNELKLEIQLIRARVTSGQLDPTCGAVAIMEIQSSLVTLLEQQLLSLSPKEAAQGSAVTLVKAA